MSCRVQLANLTLAFRSKNIATLCLPVYVTQDTCGCSLMPDALGLRRICAGIWRNHFHVLQETVNIYICKSYCAWSSLFLRLMLNLPVMAKTVATLNMAVHAARRVEGKEGVDGDEGAAALVDVEDLHVGVAQAPAVESVHMSRNAGGPQENRSWPAGQPEGVREGEVPACRWWAACILGGAIGGGCGLGGVAMSWNAPLNLDILYYAVGRAFTNVLI
ncbi:hypothetical protein D1007_37280 [Hordeum vulgare]|nr:hypothetical protein D1007_37280 [Hordeum vulgare]